MLIKHLLELAALIFFAICLGGAIWFCAFRHTDPWHDQWHQQQEAGTGPLEGVVVQPQVSLDAKVRATLARAERVSEDTASMLAIRP